MTDFDPNKYLTTRVHGGVREIVGEEAEKIRERLEMSPERMIEALNNQVRIITNERDAMTRLVQNQFEVEKELLLVKAERDGLASVIGDLSAELVKERKIVQGLLDAILEHLGASIEYDR